jgi:hypothetical protein
LIDDKKGLHFDTVEVIEAEPQAVLNSLTAHDLQDAFTEWQRRRERCIHMEGDLVFDQTASPVPEIMDDPLFAIPMSTDPTVLDFITLSKGSLQYGGYAVV